MGSRGGSPFPWSPCAAFAPVTIQAASQDFEPRVAPLPATRGLQRSWESRTPDPDSRQAPFAQPAKPLPGRSGALGWGGGEGRPLPDPPPAPPPHLPAAAARQAQHQEQHRRPRRRPRLPHRATPPPPLPPSSGPAEADPPPNPALPCPTRPGRSRGGLPLRTLRSAPPCWTGVKRGEVEVKSWKGPSRSSSLTCCSASSGLTVPF